LQTYEHADDIYMIVIALHLSVKLATLKDDDCFAVCHYILGFYTSHMI